MRTIKFRGKTPRGKWITGDLIQSIDDDKYIFPSDGYDSCNRYEVSPDTIGQFTGLKDTRANDVYEDDLLHDEDGAIIQVIYYSGCFGFIYPHQNPDTRYFYNFYDSALETKDITVIPFQIVGNIHDNPELLTNKQNKNETKSI